MFFGSKTEKTLNKCKKKGIGLEMRYADGNARHPCDIVRVEKDKVVVFGFSETLRVDHLEISIPSMRLCFPTRVANISHDVRGRVIYHCPLPEDFKPLQKKENTYFLYPRGVVALAPQDDSPESAFLTTVDGSDTVKSRKFYIWNLSEGGLEMVNSSNYVFEKGAKFEGKVQIGKVGSLVNLEISYISEKPFQKQTVKIAGGKFVSKPDQINELLELAKKIDRL